MWNPSRVPAPARRIEYFTPGQWDLYSVGEGWFDYLAQPGVQFAAGRPAAIGWNKAVAGPGAVAPAWAFRSGGMIWIWPQMFADSAGRPASRSRS